MSSWSSASKSINVRWYHGGRRERIHFLFPKEWNLDALETAILVGYDLVTSIDHRVDLFFNLRSTSAVPSDAIPEFIDIHGQWPKHVQLSIFLTAFGGWKQFDESNPQFDELRSYYKIARHTLAADWLIERDKSQ